MSRQTISSLAHCTLFLSLIFMVLEVEHIGKLWGHGFTNKSLVSLYCALQIATMLSYYFLTFKSRWTWIFTAVLLFVYSGIAVPEGIEDFRLICRNLGGELAFIRLIFTMFLFVPFVSFAFLAATDIRDALNRRVDGRLDVST